ncbi:MAG: flavin oxidoreductase, partial [Cyanothece sp. SIO2G6]|nr:flavin oxidoreductase [Cyanothece sp. SIO2G6]
APGHGPLVQYHVSQVRRDYRQWCQAQAKQRFRVAVLYASAYGNTATLAGAIAQELVQAGIAVDSINCEQASAEEITRAITICDGFIIGSPTLGGHAPTQIQTALGIIVSTAAKTKLAGVFGSYGWSGEAVDLIEARLRNANYRLGFEPIRVRFSPTEEHLQTCRDGAAAFVQKLRRQQTQRISQPGQTDTQTNRTEQAISRVIGSLCVITTHHNISHTPEPRILHRGMLTAAVSQASFSPPGIMMAISPTAYADYTDPKRIPQPGDRFVLNILKEGRTLRRHFANGSINSTNHADVFKQLATRTANNGCLVLNDALAYLECTVETASKCGDRWLVYGQVNHGEVLAPDGITAIQHR